MGVSIMHLINIQRIACLDDSFFPNLLWKEYTLFKSSATEKYCQIPDLMNKKFETEVILVSSVKIL